MIRTVTILLSSLLLFSCAGKGKTKKDNTAATPAPAWSDEFNYNGLPDATKWNYDTGGHGWGNHELQYYTAGRKENARVENGMLIIEAHKEPWKGMQYTSARLVTRGKAEWQYKRIEVRARIPSGRGTWPAIWMLGAKQPLAWPDDGEIDIMEHVGFNQGTVHGTVHCKKYNHMIGTQKTATIPVPDCSDSFHVYATDWDKDSIRISIDGNTYFRFANERSGYEAWPFDNKMYLLLNIAVGGDWGGQKGVDSTIWPRRMEVDYVRVY
ncbi:MAG: glycoside hydrolase family 16 protein [Chitinophagaceae bacterium]|nr:glycoside hydrolase family 16 protein [Chitinophagaceae bacterium]